MGIKHSIWCFPFTELVPKFKQNQLLQQIHFKRWAVTYLVNLCGDVHILNDDQ